MPEAPRTRRSRQQLLSDDSATVITSEAMPEILSILPIDEVLYPGNALSIQLARAKEMALVEDAVRARIPIGVVAPRSAGVADAGPEELFSVGTVVRIGGLSTRSGGLSFEIQAARRMRIVEFTQKTPYLKGRVHFLDEGPATDGNAQRLATELRRRAPRVLELESDITDAELKSVGTIRHAGQFADVVAVNLSLSLEEQQLVLETANITRRIEVVLRLLKRRKKALGGAGWPPPNVLSYAAISVVLGVYLGVGAISLKTPFAWPLLGIEAVSLAGLAREIRRWLK